MEMVKKKAFALILVARYLSYESALFTLKQERLDTRRQNLSLNVALKCTLSNNNKTMAPIPPKKQRKTP
jgi:hypothetical protein